MRILTNMGSIFIGIFSWILSKVFGLVKDNQTEKKYVDAMKENLELRAQNAGLWKRHQIEQQELNTKKEWEEADQHEKYKILKRDFPDTD